MRKITSSTACQIEQAVSFLKAAANQRPLVLAFSGGMDSSVLLHALAGMQCRVSLVHVHHGLQTCADDWVLHVEQQAKHYGIECYIERVQVPSVSRRGLEDRARVARYQALWRNVPDGGVLLTAHHQRDQAETLLMRLLRGAGVKGLSAIHAEQGYDQGRVLYRPLLSIPYETLLAYAQRHQLTWVEDPTNQLDIALRNEIRHELLPLMRRYQPAIDAKLAQTAQLCQEADELLTDLARADWEKLKIDEQSWHLSDWQTLSWPRARQALAFGLSKLWQEQLASQAQWRQIKQQFYLKSKPGSHPCFVLSEHQLVCDGAIAYVIPHEWFLRPDECVVHLTQLPHQISWLPWLVFRLSSNREQKITIKVRMGGESVHLNGKKVSLKKWLQEQEVPHWQMSLWPVIYDQNSQVLGWPGLGQASSQQKLNHESHDLGEIKV